LPEIPYHLTQHPDPAHPVEDKRGVSSGLRGFYAQNTSGTSLYADPVWHRCHFPLDLVFSVMLKYTPLNGAFIGIASAGFWFILLLQ